MFLAASLIVHAENAITIHGMVMDSRNYGLPGVALFLKENSTNRESLTYTGADGKFEIEGLREGDYELRFELKGFQTITAPIQLRQEAVRIVEVILPQLEGSHKWQRQSQTESTYEYLATKIENFGRIDDHYYRGAQPEDGDYEDLAAFGITSVINLTKDDADPNEKSRVEKAGMKYHQIPMDSHTPPTDAELAEFLRIVNDPANQPVFVHCVAGKHRTGVMTAVYRLTHGWTADQAYKEMKQYKFGPALFHSKLKSFLYNYYKELTHKSTPSEPLLPWRK
jgi:tyrosine-protein phosphatase SIW14